MKRTALKRKPRRARERVTQDTVRMVYFRQGGRCACGCGGRIAPFPIGYHHVLPKARWPELVNVASNIVGVTADCHADHETGARRLPRSAVREVEALAYEYPMRSYLERTYGPVDSAEGAGSSLAGGLGPA